MSTYMEHSIQQEFEKAYLEHSESIFRFCYFRISDRNRAKDVMQDTFTQTWQYIVKGNTIDNLKAFLYKVARNLIINEISRRKEIASLEEMNEEHGFDVADENSSNTEEKSEGRRLIEFIQTLDDESKDLLTMRYLEDMSVKDIAEVMNITPNNATVKLHRATKKLQQVYNI